MSVRRTPQDSVREAAAWIVEHTLAAQGPVDSFLEPVVERFDERDLGLLQELVYGTLRWKRRLDHVLAAASDRSLERIEPPLLGPLRIAIYQLLFLDRVPSHAAVNEAVEHAARVSHRGSASFVNAVLRRIAKSPRPGAWTVREADPVHRLAIEHSHPDFLVRGWLERFGHQATINLLQVNNRPKPMQLLAFRHRGGRELLAEQLIDEGLDIEPSMLSPLGLTVRRGNPLKTKAFAEGSFYVQDEISQLAAVLTPPRPGERIYDAAAAPGGKGFALLAAEPAARLVLGDVAPGRLAILRENLCRLGVEVPVLLADAGAPPVADGPFDRVVVDLPCSGTGTLRKNPEIKWRLTESEVGRLAEGAGRLLRGASRLVAPGGLLYAITCSIEEEENEGPVAALLRDCPELAPFDLGAALAPPLDRFVAGPGLWRALPAEDHDGFTVHVLVRR